MLKAERARILVFADVKLCRGINVPQKLLDLLTPPNSARLKQTGILNITREENLNSAQ
jgi:hypothetical protein